MKQKNKKKILSICVMAVLCVSLAGCNGGRIAKANVEIGESSIYTEDEIGDAMDIVLDCFSEEFEDCYLTDLWYDEEVSVEQAQSWADQYEAEEAIVLLSEFYTGPYGLEGFSPNTTYENWQWILVRNGGDWELKTWGY